VTQPALFVLDVGHGNAAVLVDTDGVVVFDAGPGTALLEFLRQEGIRHVDTVLISHADRDHISGVVSLLESRTVTIGRVRLNSDLLKSTDLWQDLLALLDEAHTAGRLDFDVALTTRNTGEFDCGAVHIEILAPSLRLAGMGAGGIDSCGRRLRTNSISAVFRLKHVGVPMVLLGGDLDDIGLDDLLEHGLEARSPILVYPHHGGRSGTTDAAQFATRLCAIVQPTTLIFSIGRGVHATPNPSVVASVRRFSPALRIVCTELSEHCAARALVVDPDHLTKHFAQGRIARRCCAGTIVVRFRDRDVDILPEQRLHSEFIEKSAPTALCTPVAASRLVR
jgi:beta-lactamase superfamily II metal-dependent hydrolase